jgi:hypothetical protein
MEDDISEKEFALLQTFVHAREQELVSHLFLFL